MLFNSAAMTFVQTLRTLDFPRQLKDTEKAIICQNAIFAF